MDKLSNLINQGLNPNDSEELVQLKKWLKKSFPDSEIKVNSNGQNILIICPSGVLAQEIHMRIPEIRKHSKISEGRQIILRIS